MLVVDVLLQRYPGYTVGELLAEDASTVRMMLDIAAACNEAARKKE